jgi:hypothetical protein
LLLLQYTRAGSASEQRNRYSASYRPLASVNRAPINDGISTCSHGAALCLLPRQPTVSGRQTRWGCGEQRRQLSNVAWHSL